VNWDLDRKNDVAAGMASIIRDNYAESKAESSGSRAHPARCAAKKEFLLIFSVELRYVISVFYGRHIFVSWHDHVVQY